MTGFNLPPGCNVNDLPGNSQEAQRIEALYDEIYARLPESMDDSAMGELANWIVSKIDEAFGEGYEQAAADSQLAKESGCST